MTATADESRRAILGLSPRFVRHGLRFDRFDLLSLAEISSFLKSAPGFTSFLNSGYAREAMSARSVEVFTAMRATEGTMAVFSVRLRGDWIGASLLNVAGVSGGLNLAYFTLPSLRGRGLAARMAEGLLESLFDHGRAAVVHCAIWADNTASLRTLEKIGFEYMGHLPSYIDPPPVVDHQFRMTRERFRDAGRVPVVITLDPSPDVRPPSKVGCRSEGKIDEQG